MLDRETTSLRPFNLLVAIASFLFIWPGAVLGGVREKHVIHEGGIAQTSFTVDPPTASGSALLITFDAPQMSYWGLSQDDLSIYPNGDAGFYFHRDPSVGGDSPWTVSIFSKGAGRPEAKIVVGEAVAEALIDRGRVGEKFGRFFAGAREAFRTLYSSKPDWEMVLSSARRWEGDGSSGFHVSSLIDSASKVIGGALGAADLAKKGGIISGANTELQRHLEMSKRHHENSKFEDAIKSARAAVAISPRNSAALNNLGYLIFLSGGNLFSSKDYLETALEISPDNPVLRGNLSEVLRAIESENAPNRSLLKTPYGGGGS